jgi:uncharacterized GH25 family protein
MNRLVLIIMAALCTVVPARAHDYWFQPDAFFVAPGKVVELRLLMGDDFVMEEERPYQKKATLRFQRIAGKDATNLAGEEDKKPFARLTLREAGTHLIALDRGSFLIKLEAGKFNKYLKEEGLDAVLEERRKAGEDKSPGRERYSRYVKTLIGVGDRPDATPLRAIGQKLELVPRANPLGLKRDDSLTVQVLFDGKPLAGATVFACHREKEKTATQREKTDAEGLATFKMDKSGPWLIHLVHMRRAVKDADADWESFWGSLTFSLK